MNNGRSYKKIDIDDLKQLAKIAEKDREDFFSRNPGWAKLYSQRVLCVALCQGAALHFIDGRNGINDFDVWTFYSANRKPFPYRRLVNRDFGSPKFGQTSGYESFVGRKVDLIGRSISLNNQTDPFAVLLNYLSTPRTKSAKELSKKGVIILEPLIYIGKIIWPLNRSQVFRAT